MRKIDVQINKAILSHFYVLIGKDEDIDITVYLDLYSGRNKITQIDLSTNSYNSKKKFKIPFKLFEPIGKIAGELERIVALQFKAAMAELPEHNSKEI